MGSGIKAIETSYKGHRFRSRLEARWAVFFDALKIRYEYEPQGFVIDDQPYLPDFHLVEFGTWVEVKGSLDDVDDGYLNMIASAIDWGGQLPGVADSWGTPRGLLWLASIPDEDRIRNGQPCHPIIQHGKGGYVCGAAFHRHADMFGAQLIVEERGTYFDSSWGDQAGRTIRIALEHLICTTSRYIRDCDSDVIRAYRVARTARFEHGDSGGVNL